MTTSHPTAIIHPQAQIDETAQIGPFCMVGAHVTLGAHCVLHSHVTITGRTTLGSHNEIFPFVSLGHASQDKKYRGEPTQLVIGDRNTIRENVTMHLGTVQDQGITRVGNDNWIMAYVHIAHDVQLGSHTILANSTQIAGHVHIGDWVILGGMTGVHQFVHIGAHAMAGMCTALAQDVPPYVMVSGNPAHPHGINSEGLKRRGFSAESITQIKRDYKTIYRQQLSLDAAIAEFADHIDPLVTPMTEFLQHSQTHGRGIVR
jgi:UDP-N-acetylglucosamine acyltransferase